MHRALILRFSLTVFLLFSVSSYAHAIDSPIVNDEIYFCNSMPCHYTTENGMYVEIFWTVSQNAYIADLDSMVHINGVLLGELRMDAVALGDGTFDIIGEVRRDAGNNVNLPPFQVPFHINLQSPQPGTIPYLSPDDIGFLSVALTTQDITVSKSNNNNSNESSSSTTHTCGKNHTKDGDIGCDGPFRGFLIFGPIFNGDGVGDCCDAHDICFLVALKSEDECNAELFKCIEPHTPWYSSIWTGVATLDWWWGDNAGYVDNDANCRCTFNTLYYNLSLWRDMDYNQVYVGNAECCADQDKECEDNSCTWKFLKDGKEQWKFKGKCISKECNNDGVVDNGEECDVGNLGKDTCGDGLECTNKCKCQPICGNGKLDPGEECEPPNSIHNPGNEPGWVCNDDCTKSWIWNMVPPVPDTPKAGCSTAEDSSLCAEYACADPEEECMSNYGGTPACECRKKAPPAPTPSE